MTQTKNSGTDKGQDEHDQRGLTIRAKALMETALSLNQELTLNEKLSMLHLLLDQFDSADSIDSQKEIAKLLMKYMFESRLPQMLTPSKPSHCRLIYVLHEKFLYLIDAGVDLQQYENHADDLKTRFQINVQMDTRLHSDHKH